MESPEPARRTALSVPAVRRLVTQWQAALARRPSAADLLPHLANGLLLELPGRTVRGTDEFQGHFEEFRAWYRGRAGGFGFLGARPAEEVRIQLVSPIHAEVTITRAGSAAPQQETTRQIWRVVLQGGVPRIRGIAFVQHPPVVALTRP
ncbi:hypothetical protein [Streptomyces montanisoli]|uniref:Uncharacterized protein n=1 Tax=Streptomyces montanisoli TaxID=2798581 RepID=A0A940M9C7_9ACTN|nr:hypothetical protein [Streptomyces montanisoli]MBP0456296.1 hypothetical protein [Streptomyces montanisoli]